MVPRIAAKVLFFFSNSIIVLIASLSPPTICPVIIAPIVTNTPARTVFILFKERREPPKPSAFFVACPYAFSTSFSSFSRAAYFSGCKDFTVSRSSFRKAFAFLASWLALMVVLSSRFSHSAIFLLFSPIVLLFSFSCSSSLFHCLPPAFPVAIKSVIAFFISLLLSRSSLFFSERLCISFCASEAFRVNTHSI